MNSQEKLLEKSKKYENDLAEQIGELSEKAQVLGKNALMIAGGVFVAYQLVRLITGSRGGKSKVYQEVYEDEEVHKDAPRIIIKKSNSSPSLFESLKAEVSGIVLAIAREKILEFLNQLQEQYKNDRKETTE